MPRDWTKLNESAITRDLCAALTPKGAHCSAIAGSKFGTPGVPDRHVHSVWWSGFFEAKNEHESLSDEQLVWHYKARRRDPGGAVIFRYWRAGSILQVNIMGDGLPYREEELLTCSLDSILIDGRPLLLGLGCVSRILRHDHRERTRDTLHGLASQLDWAVSLSPWASSRINSVHEHLEAGRS